MNIDQPYQAKNIEKKLYQHWEQAGYFVPQGNGPNYSIVIPPPNVTGTLHMGHGFQNAIMDTLIRYHRMSDNKTLWQPGMDHAGIATQMVVERQLAQQNQSKYDLGREQFIERIWDWKKTSGGKISEQIRRLGSSPDWSRECFTMDDRFNGVVKKIFIQLHEEGLIYRGKRLVNWDPKLHTAISDLEVVTEEEQGFLWHIRYPLVDSDQFIEIATTRPETLLGDAAIAVNPNDERYQALIGQKAKLPLTEREIPIIADDYVDPEFGTGCVKITPAHDFNDYAIGQRHQLPMINVFTHDANLNDNVPEAYRNLDRFVARKKVLNDLKERNLLVKTENHTLKIPRGDRSGVIIEPYLTEQWYVKVAPLAEPAIKAVKEGQIKFVPENWDKTYFRWMENIEDWCISRQLWWGHRVPAWYDGAGNVYVGENEADIRKKHQLSDDITLKQDDDVLDTWFSSAIWPFATLGWPEDIETLNQFYPTSVLVTGFDIIFFWVARMIMFGLKFTGKIPFHEVYITGLIRDSEGHKMSKSKGNVLDPIDLIDGVDLNTLVEKRTHGLMQPEMAKKIEAHTRKEYPNGIDAHGTDALRFTFCALANNSRDIRFDLGRLEGYRNFCNKLWNAAKFVVMNTKETNIRIPSTLTQTKNPINGWIISRLQHTIEKAHQNFKQYRFDFLSQTLYEFTWYEFCDWYLELSKVILQNPDISENEKNETCYTLLYVLENILRLLHPIMPFITETIWLDITPLLNIEAPTIMQQPYPTVESALKNEPAENTTQWLQSIVLAIRNIRGEMNITPNKAISILLRKGSAGDQQYFEQAKRFLMSMAKLNHIEWLDETQEPPASATAIVGTLEVFVPMADFIDKAAELARLEKELAKLNADIEKLTVKLDNPQFVNKAPAAVVDKEKSRLQGLKDTMAGLQKQKLKIEGL